MMALLLVLWGVVLLCQYSSAQENPREKLAHMGFGIKISTLGAGIESAVPLFGYSQLRTGFNYFVYDRDLSDGGVGYRGELNLCSAQATYDWYPFHGAFHFGPTVLIYNGTHVGAKLGVPAGQNFSISKSTFVSDPSNPIKGGASMTFAKVAPGFVFGWGNLLSRRHHHLSFPVEFGFIYEGTPHVSLNMNGAGCDVSGLGCSTLANDPSATSSIAAEQTKLAHEVTFLRFYPVVSVGIGFSF